MTDKEILLLAKKYLETGEHCDDGYCSPDWSSDDEQLLKFARAVRQDGYSEGYDDGYESAKVSTSMNTWSSDDD